MPRPERDARCSARGTSRALVAARALGVALLTALSLVALVQASMVVDGTRWFWLDDDVMISMRYARNLADGHGPVWNPGERTEGYTNPLWTLAMAAVHLLPIGDARMAVAVRGLGWLLAIAVLLLAERLYRVLAERPSPLAITALWLLLPLAADVTYWATKGFETTLLTVLFLYAVAGVLADPLRPRRIHFLAAALLPLVRSDAQPVWAAFALVALGASRDRARTARLLALSLVPSVLHLLMRHAYYGAWLPNTYYLKVEGVPDAGWRGLVSLWRFACHYWLAIALALAGAVRAADHRRWLLLAGALFGFGHSLVVGGDIFLYSRFLAYLVPVLVVLALLGADDLTPRASLRAAAALAIAVSILLPAGATPRRLDTSNWWIRDAVRTALWIRGSTAPDCRVAVFAAGNLPYFARRPAVDLLGKTDAWLARQPSRLAGTAGHTKVDPEHSLAVLAPDLVVPHVGHHSVLVAVENPQRAAIPPYVAALVRSPEFRRWYLPNPVLRPDLLAHGAVYVRSGSEAKLNR